jgi:hypothetical protein
MNVFGEVWITHRSLDPLGTSFKGQTSRFNTLGYVQGVKVELDEHRRTTIMFKQATTYNVQMTNILLKLFNLEIKNKDIIMEKDRFVQNL